MRCRVSLIMLPFVLAAFSLRPSTALGQSEAGNETSAEKSRDQILPQTPVPPDAAVMTIHGLCGYTPLPGTTDSSQPSAKTSDVTAITPDPKCETVVTRQQFENLMRGMAPKADPRGGRTVALNYEETLVFARKAVEAGLDKDPAWQGLLEFKYQQALYSIFKASVKQKANAMSDAELKSFYDANLPRFEEFKILRIFVPKAKEHQPSSTSTTSPNLDVPAEEREMEALARRIRAEAVAGGDFDRLQAKAYKLAGQTDDPPDTDLGEWTRDSIPEESAAAILNLKAGQISQPIGVGDGWQIVKLVSKRMVPWGDEARNKALQMVVADQANAVRKSIHTDFNNEYFSSAQNSDSGTPAK